MQIVKSDTYRVLNVAAKLYLSICAPQFINISIIIHMRLLYIQILI